MTALRQQALQLVKQIPEDQVPDIIQHLHSLLGNVGHPLENEATISPKLKVFWTWRRWSNPYQSWTARKS